MKQMNIINIQIKQGGNFIMIGEVVRVTRIANDFTIKDLSEKSQVSKSYINEIEKGKKTPSNDK